MALPYGIGASGDLRSVLRRGQNYDEVLTILSKEKLPWDFLLISRSLELFSFLNGVQEYTTPYQNAIEDTGSNLIKIPKWLVKYVNITCDNRGEFFKNVNFITNNLSQFDTDNVLNLRWEPPFNISTNEHRCMFKSELLESVLPITFRTIQYNVYNFAIKNSLLSLETSSLGDPIEVSEFSRGWQWDKLVGFPTSLELSTISNKKKSLTSDAWETFLVNFDIKDITCVGFDKTYYISNYVENLKPLEERGKLFSQTLYSGKIGDPYFKTADTRVEKKLNITLTAEEKETFNSISYKSNAKILSTQPCYNVDIINKSSCVKINVEYQLVDTGSFSIANTGKIVCICVNVVNKNHTPSLFVSNEHSTILWEYDSSDNFKPNYTALPQTENLRRKISDKRYFFHGPFPEQSTFRLVHSNSLRNFNNQEAITFVIHETEPRADIFKIEEEIESTDSSSEIESTDSSSEIESGDLEKNFSYISIAESAVELVKVHESKLTTLEDGVSIASQSNSNDIPELGIGKVFLLILPCIKNNKELEGSNWYSSYVTNIGSRNLLWGCQTMFDLSEPLSVNALNAFIQILTPIKSKNRQFLPTRKISEFPLSAGRIKYEPTSEIIGLGELRHAKSTDKLDRLGLGVIPLMAVSNKNKTAFAPNRKTQALLPVPESLSADYLRQINNPLPSHKKINSTVKKGGGGANETITNHVNALDINLDKILNITNKHGIILSSKMSNLLENTISSQPQPIGEQIDSNKMSAFTYNKIINSLVSGTPALVEQQKNTKKMQQVIKNVDNDTTKEIEYEQLLLSIPFLSEATSLVEVADDWATAEAHNFITLENENKTSTSATQQLYYTTSDGNTNGDSTGISTSNSFLIPSLTKEQEVAIEYYLDNTTEQKNKYFILLSAPIIILLFNQPSSVLLKIAVLKKVLSYINSKDRISETNDNYIEFSNIINQVGAKLLEKCNLFIENLKQNFKPILDIPSSISENTVKKLSSSQKLLLLSIYNYSQQTPERKIINKLFETIGQLLQSEKGKIANIVAKFLREDIDKINSEFVILQVVSNRKLSGGQSTSLIEKCIQAIAFVNEFKRSFKNYGYYEGTNDVSSVNSLSLILPKIGFQVKNKKKINNDLWEIDIPRKSSTFFQNGMFFENRHVMDLFSWTYIGKIDTTKDNKLYIRTSKIVAKYIVCMSNDFKIPTHRLLKSNKFILTAKDFEYYLDIVKENKAIIKTIS